MNSEIKKYLGVDWGKSKIGIAVADSENRTAIPYQVVKNINELAKIIKNEKINIFYFDCSNLVRIFISRNISEFFRFYH